MSGIVLPKEFVYPMAAVVSSSYLLIWQQSLVGRARKRAGIPYPQVYADKAEVSENKEALKFNCAQRAHQNTLETIPVVLGSIIIAGLRYPAAAGVLGGLWVLSRVLYTIGYSTGDPKKRNMAGGSLIGIMCTLGLVGASTATVISLIRSVY